MNSTVRAFAAESDDFMERLQSRYEAEGFEFVRDPGASELPAFFGSYRPDALARKSGMNVAIEIKTHPAAEKQTSLQEIQRLMEGHTDWRLGVVYRNLSSLESTRIPRPARSEIVRRIGDVRVLIGLGQLRPAFVMAWALLEAAYQNGEEEAFARPRGTGAVLEALAMNGYIASETERKLRGRDLELRNRIVHGDVVAEPSQSDVDLVLAAVEEALHVAVE